MNALFRLYAARSHAFQWLALGLVLGAPVLHAAPTIPNPSFEADHFTSNIAPYILYNTPITGWTVADADKEYVGLNPSNGTNDFANNGATPDGTNIAFIQCRPGHGRVALSTTITGLTSGQNYHLQFRANARAGGTPFATYKINGGTEVNFAVNAVDNFNTFTNHYLTIGADFTATATTATLELANNATTDSSVLLDAFTITSGPIVVTSNADTGPGTLRAAFATAAANPGPDTITFDPSLNGATISLATAILSSDTGGVTVDATSLPSGLAVTASGTDRLFYFFAGAVCTFTRLTVRNANSTFAGGGAVYNAGTLTLNQCTFSGNSTTTGSGGGGYKDNPGMLTCTQCTFASNSCTNYGGAIFSKSSQAVQLTHCTVALNHAGIYGGGLYTSVSTTVLGMANCLLVLNTADGSSATRDAYTFGSLTFTGVNMVSSFISNNDNVSFTGVIVVSDPKLGPLADNGGPTQTMALLSGSPAVDAAVGSSITADQRGRPVVDRADVGAFEMQAGGSFSFSASTYQALEGYPLIVTIARGGDSIGGSATVRLLTTPGTPAAADFITRADSTTSDVTFTSGESQQDVLIYPTKNAPVKAGETFTLTLTQPRPAGVATLGATTSATVTVSTTKPLQVSNTNDDGPGSLRQVLATAAAAPGYNAVTFAPALNGQTITLGSEIVVTDTDGVMVDATGLAAGITIDGGGSSRIFSVATGARLDLRRLTLAHGNGVGATTSGNGGALYNKGRACLFQCTLTGNSTQFQAGALQNSSTGTLVLVQCTIAGNQAGTLGGGLTNFNRATLTQCTVTGNTTSYNNSAGFSVTGGGIFVSSSFATARLTLENSIVAGNTALLAPDLGLADAGCQLLLKGFNIVPQLGNPDGGIITGINDPLTFDPLLGPLSANGGPTKTCALLAGSPAVNNAYASPFSTDQRGFPIVGNADMGAFEAQNGGTFTLSQTGYLVPENVGHVTVTILRGGGLFGTASVKVSAAPGTAGAADFAVGSSILTFAAGESSKTVDIGIDNDQTVEANETFTVTLSAPSAGYTLGSPSSAKVVIEDPSTTDNGAGKDLVLPAAPVITSPAANASVNVETGGTLTLTGTATDNKGVYAVAIYDASNVQLGFATLEAPGGASTKWTAQVTPVTGTNTFRARAADFQQATNISAASAPRTVKVLRPLVVNISGNGSVTSGYAPRSFREVGKPQTVTATPRAGAIFKGWTILSSHTPAQISTTTAALGLPTLTFIHQDGLTVRASFITSPYTLAVAGTFNGGITPAASATLSNLGAISLTVTANGTFTAALKLDGTTYPAAGLFDAAGTARFGPGRATSLTLPRKNLPGLTLALAMNLASPFNGLVTGTLSQFDGTNILSSAISAQRAPYSATNLVPNTVATPYLNAGNADGTYTAEIESDGSPSGFPNGLSIATVKVSKTGQVTAVCKLSEGTTTTVSSTLGVNGGWYFFAPLYGGQGLMAGQATFDFTQNVSDFLAPLTWLRPIQDSQYYPAGWPQGVSMTMTGAKFKATAGSSILPGLAAIPSNPGTGYTGNAQLVINLDVSHSATPKTVAITPADIATPAPADASFNLKLDRTTGLFSGTFTLPDGSKPVYQGAILQKALTPGIVIGFPGGYGFYLTVMPKVKDYTGASFEVGLSTQ